MFNLQYEITAEDYLEADMTWFSRPWFKWIVVRGVPAGLTLFCLISGLFYDQLYAAESEYDQLFVRWMFVFYALVGLIFSIVMQPQVLSKQRRRIINRAIAQDPTHIGNRQTMVNETGIYLDKLDQFDRKRLVWQQIRRWRETENLFIFDFKYQRQCTFIPKRALESKQHIDAFRSVIQSCI